MWLKCYLSAIIFKGLVTSLLSSIYNFVMEMAMLLHTFKDSTRQEF